MKYINKIVNCPPAKPTFLILLPLISLFSAGEDHGYSPAEAAAAGWSNAWRRERQVVPLSPGRRSIQAIHGRLSSTRWNGGYLIGSSCQIARNVRWYVSQTADGILIRFTHHLTLNTGIIKSVFSSGLTAGGNLSTLELSPMMGGMKDMSGQQSRFKWMMEGHSPAPSPPDTALHKNGRLTCVSQWDF